MSAAEEHNMELQRELERLEVLRSYDVLDTPAEEVFDEFARLAAAIVGTPTALISLVDDCRQWFKARVGLEASETPREVAFCAHAMHGDDVFIVPDATADPRFADNPLVTSGPRIRFYAGAPLVTEAGQPLGTLCVIDYVPRELKPDQQQSLRILSRHVMAQLELRRRLQQFTKTQEQRRDQLIPLHRALAQHEFVLHYQPRVSLKSGRIVGVEALLRWHRTDVGWVAASDFVALLEESGLMLQLGSWVLRQAHSDYQRWLSLGIPAPRIAVNLSTSQIQAAGFVRDLEELLACGAGSHEGSSAGIDLEVREALLLERTEESIEKLRAATQMGCRILLDDFGTGHSPLRYLAELPIHSLKIDRSFVQAMSTSPGQMAIVSCIISLAHGLNMTAVAEGVETDEQRRLLRLMRCDEMQGYQHSRPMPREELENLLRSEPSSAAIGGNLP
jgi:EAL domain-containing protein (putative c-di-GMP-specific phosphodiesterase class I)